MNMKNPKLPAAAGAVRLVFGILVIVVGLLFTLDNFGLVSARFLLRLWPVALVAVGLTKALQRRGFWNGFWGWVIALAGTLLLLDNLERPPLPGLEADAAHPRGARHPPRPEGRGKDLPRPDDREPDGGDARRDGDLRRLGPLHHDDRVPRRRDQRPVRRLRARPDELPDPRRPGDGHRLHRVRRRRHPRPARLGRRREGVRDLRRHRRQERRTRPSTETSRRRGSSSTASSSSAASTSRTDVHPILARRERLLAYLLAWVPLAAIQAYLLALPGSLSIGEAAALAAPLSLVYAFLCLSSFYACRSAPLTRARTGSVLGVHVVGALIAASLLTLAGSTLASLLGTFPDALDPPGAVREGRAAPLRPRRPPLPPRRDVPLHPPLARVVAGGRAAGDGGARPGARGRARGAEGAAEPPLPLQRAQLGERPDDDGPGAGARDVRPPLRLPPPEPRLGRAVAHPAPRGARPRAAVPRRREGPLRPAPRGRGGGRRGAPRRRSSRRSSSSRSSRTPSATASRPSSRGER